MNLKNKYKYLPVLFFLNSATMLTLSGQTTGNSGKMQTGDSLSLKNVIEKVISTYPTVRVAEEAIRSSEARIGLAATGYNPELDISASFSNIGPVSKLTVPNMGTFQLYPGNNYSAGVNLKQTVYDFGRTKNSVSFEKENKAIGEQSLEQVKQKLSLMTISTFYNLSYLQEAIRIKQQEIDALKEHLSYVEKKMATGSSTEYEVLTTKVRISAVESQETDLNAALTNQQVILNSLLGNDPSARPVVMTELSVEDPVLASDSLLNYAYTNRDEMLINKRRAEAADLKYQMIGLQNMPVLNFVATGGAKNGYIPDLNKITPNYVLGLGLRIPIYDASRTKYNKLQAKSAVNSVNYETEYTRRTISTDISEAQTAIFAAEKKVKQFELQVSQAVKALSLAETSFKSGTITNLDLLDSNTSLSESRLLLMKAKIDYAASIYRLKAAIGARLYR
jgi:outer membrane protein